ncbi:hypothetical protein [Clostridium sp. ZBS2]|uniref:hypothetical protein n=1 Tax=Clostridium sp. ZBS2 TaxID=2949976 RepID=UPI002079A469|nr:hypothetical protein [Clostridium sp. ZBS2]
MIRFPNPGTNPNNFIQIFKLTYNALHDRYFFTLDDMTEVLACESYITCRGFAGKRAIEQSNDSSKALQPLYNQCKMYSELFRSLGWIKSTSGKNLNFSFTFIGQHVATAIDAFPLFKECLLGINYPNNVIKNKSQNIRPFYCILKSLKDLNGILTRDEMILAPMSIDDTDVKDYNDKINYIKDLRQTKNYIEVKDALKLLSANLEISTVTLGNYTRFPIAMLSACGWIEKTSLKSIYSNIGATKFLKLTTEGEKILLSMEDSLDIRCSVHYTSNDKFLIFDNIQNTKKELIRTSIFSMLERSGFDISPLIDTLKYDFELVKSNFNNSSILFSPYQTIESKIVDEALSDFLSSVKNNVTGTYTITKPIDSVKIDYCNLNTILKFSNIESTNKISNIAEEELQKLYTDNEDIYKVVDLFCEKHSRDNQDVFYPLIGYLFNILGLTCRVSRQGENYQRFDALIIDNEFSIPIEIKSPGEETNISTKAVRQALENKIVLLSRNSEQYKTDYETISIALGFNLPNNRSDVLRLITDIKTTFDINISLIDFKTLTIMAVNSLFNNKTININALAKAGGIINV